MADHREFAKRLQEACDRNPNIPPYGKGMQVAIAKKMGISQEAVRRWFEGESRPRPTKMTELAKVVDVDESWLAIGTDPVMSKKGKREYSKQAEASVYLLFGIFMANGHSVAFSDNTDGGVDLYAIKGGQQKALSVTTGYQDGNDFIIPVRTSFRNTVNIAVIPTGCKDKFEILVMDHEGVEEFESRGHHGCYINITAVKNGVYISNDHKWEYLSDSGLL